MHAYFPENQCRKGHREQAMPFYLSPFSILDFLLFYNNTIPVSLQQKLELLDLIL